MPPLHCSYPTALTRQMRLQTVLSSEMVPMARTLLIVIGSTVRVADMFGQRRVSGKIVGNPTDLECLREGEHSEAQLDGKPQ
jgi:hypothetical protein